MDLRELADEKVEMQIAPLIDVVFLLLIYFMVTATLVKSETDMSISLPASVSQDQSLDIPDEQIIEVYGDGKIVLNNFVYGADGSRHLPDFEDTLTRFRESSEMMGVPTLVTIQPDDEASHARVIDVLNACLAAKVKNISFTMGGD